MTFDVNIIRNLCWLPLTISLVGTNAAFGHGDLDIRIAAASREIAWDTNNALLYLQRGELHREHKDWPAATADYDRVAALDSRIATVNFYRGRMLADADQLPEALKALDTYVNRHPIDGHGFIERARVKGRMGNHTNAVDDFTQGITLAREPQPEFYLERAQALLALGETNQALAGLDEGITKLGPVVTLQVCAIDLELAQKKLDEAVARLNTIIPQALRKENWLMRRGEIEMQAGRTNAARASFEEALRAIDILPARLQLNRPMAELRARVNQALVSTTNAPATSTSNAK